MYFHPATPACLVLAPPDISSKFLLKYMLQKALKYKWMDGGPGRIRTYDQRIMSSGRSVQRRFHLCKHVA